MTTDDSTHRWRHANVCKGAHKYARYVGEYIYMTTCTTHEY